jgi:hypothetical protein
LAVSLPLRPFYLTKISRANTLSETTPIKQNRCIMPISFTCPHCGTTTDVAEQYAGQSGPCARCGKLINIPGAPPMDAGYSGPPPRSGVPIWAVLLIVAAVSVPVLGICAGLLLPAVQAARAAAQRVSCMNNLKQIGLAMHNYASVYGSFPPAYIADKNGRPMHSWRVLLLPYLEENALYRQYDFKEPWDGPRNSSLAAITAKVYVCPSDPSMNTSQTSYLMLTGPGCISSGANSTKPGQFANGLSKTIMVIECANSGVNWMEPRDCDAVTFHAKSPHPMNYNVLFGDGSVRAVPEGELKVLLSQVSRRRSGNDPPDVPGNE